MASPNLEEVKSIIRGLLTSNPLMSNISQLSRDYRHFVGAVIPFKSFGFQTLESFLRHLSDTVVIRGTGMQAELRVITAKAGHIGAMVDKQKINSKRGQSRRRKSVLPQANILTVQKSVGLKNPQPVERSVTPEVDRFFGLFKNQSNANQSSITLEAVDESQKNDMENQTCVQLSERCELQSQRYAQSSPECDSKSQRCDQSSPECDSQPNSFSRSTQTCDVKPSSCSATSNIRPQMEERQQSQVVRTNQSWNNNQNISNIETRNKSPIPLSEKLKLVPVKVEFPMANTRVPRHVQKNIKELMEVFPNGILCTSFPDEYLKKFRKEFKHPRYRYNTLLELLGSLRHLVEYKKAGKSDYLVFKAGTTVPDVDSDEDEANVQNERLEHHRSIWDEVDLRNYWSLLPVKIPADALHLGNTISIYFDRGWKPGDTLQQVEIGEIFDLSKFWIANETSLNKLMDDLQLFFKWRQSEYKIPSLLLQVDLYCVVFHFNRFHRGCIVDVTKAKPDYIVVYMFDYGTTDFVSPKDFYYLPKQFADVPCQAIRARLSNVMPPVENDIWSVKSVQRFVELGRNTKLVAEIISIEEDSTLEIYLANVAEKSSIFFINEVLVEDGHAVYTHQERIKPVLEDPNCIPLVKYLHLYPTFEELETGKFLFDMMYIQTNDDVPAHHYMIEYFHITLPGDNDEIDRIENAFEKNNKPIGSFKLNSLEYKYDDSYMDEAELEAECEKKENVMEQKKEKVEMSTAAKRRLKLMSMDVDLPYESMSTTSSFHSAILDDAPYTKIELISPHNSALTSSEKEDTTTNQNQVELSQISPIIDRNPFRNPFFEDIQAMNLLKTPTIQESNLGFLEQANIPVEKTCEAKRISTPPGFSSNLLQNPGVISNGPHHVPNFAPTTNLNYNAPQYASPTTYLNHIVPQCCPTTLRSMYDSTSYFPPNMPAATNLSYNAASYDTTVMEAALHYQALIEQLKLLSLYGYNSQPQQPLQNYQFLSQLQNSYPTAWQDVAGALPPGFYPPVPK